jgi:hypothetical protein
LSRFELATMLRLALGGFALRPAAGGQKGVFERRELGWMLGCPLDGLPQARRAIQDAVVASDPLPRLDRAAELPLHAKALAVLVQRFPEPGPLVMSATCATSTVLASKVTSRVSMVTSRASASERSQDFRLTRGRRRQLGDRDTSARVLCAFPELGQTHEHGASDCLSIGAQLFEWTASAVSAIAP